MFNPPKNFGIEHARDNNNSHVTCGNVETK